MTQKIYSILVCCLLFITIQQSAQAQQVPVVISGGTLHIGDGTIIEQGLVIVRNGKIEYAGVQKDHGYDTNTASLIDATGKHIYPGIIGLTSEIGLKEIEAVRSTRDAYEVGAYNPNIRSVIAYNTDSRVIPTVRANGILLAQVTPNGGVINGQSSIMKLSGWNWEDAAVATDGNMHMHWPSAYRYDYEKGVYGLNPGYSNEVAELKAFMTEAKAYCQGNTPEVKNLRFEAMRDVFSGKQKVFIEANHAKEIIGAVDLGDAMGIKIVITGGRQAYRVTELLSQKQVPVVLAATQELPAFDGDPVDLVFKMPSILKNAGVLCGLTINNEGSSYWNIRNLPFQAGNAVAYGISKEEALQMITLNNARIAGIDKDFGSLTTGKSATLFISEGDALDMRTNQVTTIFIAGERIKPENWQDDLEHKYELKYGIQVKE